jgi:hypothetical protein
MAHTFRALDIGKNYLRKLNTSPPPITYVGDADTKCRVPDICYAGDILVFSKKFYNVQCPAHTFETIDI